MRRWTGRAAIPVKDGTRAMTERVWSLICIYVTRK